ncbi:MAG: histidine kinase [Myxococcota bacterium]
MSWRYWTLHVLGWLYVDAFIFGFWGVEVHVMADAPLSEVLAIQGVVIALSLGVSGALAHGYELSWRRLRGRRAAVAVVAQLLAGVGLWTWAFPAALRTTSYLDPSTGYFPELWTATTMSVLLTGWTGLFFLPVFVRRSRTAEERNLRLMALAKEAQLASLRARLEPHFLFNSLSSLVGLIDEDPAEAREMTCDIAALFRRALDASGEEMTTVADELGFLRQYLRCEQHRLGDALTVRFDVPDALRGEPMPSMLLQPLVENALKHGGRADGTNEVVIAGHRAGEELVLEVRNAGRLAEPTGAEPTEHPGAGLRLVRDRLAVRYGESARFALAAEGGAVVARVAFPSSYLGSAALAEAAE